MPKEKPLIKLLKAFRNRYYVYVLYEGKYRCFCYGDQDEVSKFLKHYYGVTFSELPISKSL